MVEHLLVHIKNVCGSNRKVNLKDGVDEDLNLGQKLIEGGKISRKYSKFYGHATNLEPEVIIYPLTDHNRVHNH